MSLRMCVLLWEQPGRGKELAEFEETVLARLPAYGGTVIARDTVIDRADGHPLEVQILAETAGRGARLTTDRRPSAGRSGQAAATG
jgi:hypothetical protein